MIKLTPTSYSTTKWSGGETTELLIYPSGSSFANRQFQYRLSIATIRISSSDFTPLPGVARTLLLLEGELKLIHEGHHQSFLMPFSQDQFKGEWQTHSVGIAKDFNLMTKDHCNGEITVLSHDYEYTSAADHVAFYCPEGNALINGNAINENETLIFDEKLPFLNIEIEGKLIMIEIFFS